MPVDIASAQEAQIDALEALDEDGGPILIRDPSDGTDYEVNALRLDARQKDMTGETVTIEDVRFMVAALALSNHGIEETIAQNWKIVDGVGNVPPSVDPDEDPLGKIVLITRQTAGAGLSSLIYLTANFG